MLATSQFRRGQYVCDLVVERERRLEGEKRIQLPSKEVKAGSETDGKQKKWTCPPRDRPIVVAHDAFRGSNVAATNAVKRLQRRRRQQPSYRQLPVPDIRHLPARGLARR